MKADTKSEYNILKIYMKLYIFAGIILGLLEIIRYESLGEVPGMQLSMSRADMILLLVLHTVSLAMVYPFFLATKDSRTTCRKIPGCHMKIDYKKIHTVTFIILIAELLFTIRTGNAVVGKEVTSKFSFIFNMIKVSAWMPVYYVCAREIKKPLYWCNVGLYVVYELLCGWSGHIIQVIFFEMFFYMKQKRGNRRIRAFFRFSSVMTVAAFTIGSFLYRYLFSFKNSIRSSVPFGTIPPLRFAEGAEQLLSRFTNFPVTVAAVQNHTRIAGLYTLQNKPFWEVESILSPLVPRFLMPHKEYRPLGNIVKWAIWDDLERGTGTGYNFFVYWANILECNIGCFIAGVLVFVILFYISKKVIYAFDDGSKNVELLYFFFIFGMMSETALSTTFGYGYISLVYTIPFLIMTGAVKIIKPSVRQIYPGRANGQVEYDENIIYNKCGY